MQLENEIEFQQQQTAMAESGVYEQPNKSEPKKKGIAERFTEKLQQEDFDVQMQDNMVNAFDKMETTMKLIEDVQNEDDLLSNTNPPTFGLLQENV